MAFAGAKEPCHILFSGHMGSGISTELCRLLAMLEDGGHLVCYANIEGKLDQNTLKHTDLVVFLLESLLICAAEKGIAIKADKLEFIKSYLQTEDTRIMSSSGKQQTELDASIELKIPPLLGAVLGIVAKLRALLQLTSEYREEWRRKIEPDITIYIEMINDVILELRSAASKKGYIDSPPIILIDSLEKVSYGSALELFRSHSVELTKVFASMVVSFPVALSYTPEFSQIASNYRYNVRLPMIKLRTWDQNERRYIEADVPLDKSPGCIALREIILRRVDESLISEDALMLMIQKTGGFLRDLLFASYSATLNALGNKRSRIEVIDARIALNRMRSEISARFPMQSAPVLLSIIGGDKIHSFDSKGLVELLQSGAVLEYNGDRWVDAHPLVKEWMEKAGLLQALKSE
jgi:hypothetical protein